MGPKPENRNGRRIEALYRNLDTSRVVGFRMLIVGMSR